MEFQDWGLIEYSQALAQQESLVKSVHTKNLDGVLVFCTHPAVVTTGRKTQSADIFAWSGPIIEVSRGGRATYHGPSQLVVYPIYNLAKSNIQKPRRDIAWYLKTLENSLIETLNQYNLVAEGKTFSEETGVWINDKKIASLGIAVRHWVSFHGMAINLDEDAQAFSGMNPCGLSKDVMTNLEKAIGKKISRAEFAERLKSKLIKNLL